MNWWRLGAVLTINESHVHHDKQLLKNLLKLKLFDNLKKINNKIIKKIN